MNLLNITSSHYRWKLFGLSAVRVAADIAGTCHSVLGLFPTASELTGAVGRQGASAGRPSSGSVPNGCSSETETARRRCSSSRWSPSARPAPPCSSPARRWMSPAREDLAASGGAAPGARQPTGAGSGDQERAPTQYCVTLLLTSAMAGVGN